MKMKIRAALVAALFMGFLGALSPRPAFGQEAWIAVEAKKATLCRRVSGGTFATAREGQVAEVTRSAEGFISRTGYELLYPEDWEVKAATCAERGRPEAGGALFGYLQIFPPFSNGDLLGVLMVPQPRRPGQVFCYTGRGGAVRHSVRSVQTEWRRWGPFWYPVRVDREVEETLPVWEVQELSALSGGMALTKDAPTP